MSQYKLKFFLAADAVMYLPIFVAKEKGLFRTLIPEADVDLITASGDDNAVSRMVQANRQTNNKTTVALAIADPNAIDNPNDKRIIENARAIGVLIGCPSFWGVSSKDIECQVDGIKSVDFEKVIHYKKNFFTGFSIGTSVASSAGIDDTHTVEKLGEEFSFLVDGNIIITPDLLNVAVNTFNKKSFINYHFAHDVQGYISKDYLTTAIITSQSCIDDPLKEDILVRVIVAIQTAKAIIYASEQIAREILRGMNCIKIRNFNRAQTDGVVSMIIEIINEDHLYPSDFNITETRWRSTATDSLQGAFNELVNNEIVLKAERIIAEKYGITIDDTFAEEIDRTIKAPYEKEIQTLCDAMEILKKKQRFHVRFKEWVSRAPIAFVLMILTLSYSLTWTIAKYSFAAAWTEKGWTAVLTTSFALPLFWFVLRILTAKKSDS